MYSLKNYYNDKTKQLTIPDYFDEELIDIPEETKIIDFGESSVFNQSVDDLPQNITHLTFGRNYNQPIDNLPLKLTYLTLGPRFNQSVDYLPKNLTHLYFKSFSYSYFNQSVNNLPSSITHIKFNHNFNKKVDSLSKNLTQLIFGDAFNQKIDNLPKNLTIVILGHKFNQKIDNLPKNLIYLSFGWNFQNEIILPKNLKNLSLTCINALINNIPNQIENIYINFFWTDILNKKKVENLPFTIKKIIIHDEKYKNFIKIPFETILVVNDYEYSYQNDIFFDNDLHLN